MDRTVYDISNGEVVLYPMDEYLTLIYDDSEQLEFPDEDDFPDWMFGYGGPLHAEVEIVLMRGIDNIFADYIQNRSDRTHFLVLHDDLCDVYIPDGRSIGLSGIPETAGTNVWLKYTYHRNMYLDALREFACECFTGLQDSFSDMDVSSMRIGERVGDADILCSNEWGCSKYKECKEQHPPLLI
ncbi:hypothetical protein GQ54DRAFT_311721 [Martensiomyces pterosporus]|nr:hypothetical protein GQ54DRAFT_311721 [Martensiomyces pterosporus]